MQIDLLLASSNSFYREGVAAILQRIFDECSVTHVPTINHLERQLRRDQINLILIDNGIVQEEFFDNLLINMRRSRPEVPVCMLAHSTSSNMQVKSAFELGVKGYLHTSSSIDEIEKTITKIVGGRVSFPDSVWRQEKKRFVNDGRLTVRQEEILKHIERGQSNKAIAASLNLSLPTVKRHVSNIFRALGATNRVEAINIFEKGTH